MSDRQSFAVLGIATAALLLALMLTGCASTYVARESARELRQARALMARDLGEGAVGIGLDVTALDALTHQPLKQAGAAVVDAASLYALYQGVREIADAVNGDDDKRDTVVVEGNQGPVTVNGKSDSVVVRDNAGPVMVGQ